MAVAAITRDRYATLAQRVKLVHAGKRKLTLKRFEAVTQATLNRKKIRIQHYNRQNGETVDRTIAAATVRSSSPAPKAPLSPPPDTAR